MKKIVLMIVALAAVYWSIGFVLSPMGSRPSFDRIHTEAYGVSPKDVSNSTVSDGENLWIGNYCFIHGENLLPVMLLEKTPPDGIHPPMKDNVPYMPWSYVIGNLFVPGFFPLHVALWWEVIITLALFVWMGIRIYHMIIRQHAAFFAVLVTALCFAQYGYLPNFTFLNPSFFVIPLIVLGVLYGAPLPVKSNRNNSWMHCGCHEIISGCLLGIALMKPQMAALFFIPFLIRKQIIPLVIGTLWVIVPWLFMSWLYGENPFTYLSYYLSPALHIGIKINNYMGLLDPLIKSCENPSIAHLIQVAFFAMLATFLCWRFRKAQNIVIFAIPAVFSTLWTYSTATNLPVLAILIIAACMSFFKSENKIEKVVLFGGVVFMLLPIAEVFRPHYSPVILPIVQRVVYLTILTTVLIIEKRNLRYPVNPSYKPLRRSCHGMPPSYPISTCRTAPATPPNTKR
jgi:hypothetical protein